MFEESLKCVECDKEYSPDKPRFRCECGGALDVKYDYKAVQDRIDWETLDKRNFDHNRYRELFPVVEKEHLITLGEGGTPLIRAEKLGEELGLNNLYIKFEGMNPTGSFKDRGTAVEIGKALEFGAEEIIVASTGNMGASISAYAAKAGIKANIFIPNQVPDIKFRQMKKHGAEIHQVDGDYAKAAKKAKKASKNNDWYLMGDYPYRGEGEKSVGFEIVDEIEADKVILPVGNGTLMHGTYKGIKELERLGMVNRVPEMIGIQAEDCNTVAKAYKEGLSEVPEAEEVDTVAGAIACADPLDGKFALEAIRESEGFADTVSDKEIKEGVDMLAEKEGIYAEESCGTVLAGLRNNLEKFDKGEVIVLVVTGHGLKT
ncbi:MAG: threonine synthase [Candidatus Nanohaloarchaeota archaeon QJJ-9]|nr:threonine synthase [Candidatus Nanohaloarchaeota archaeon QJJ-9]